MKNTSNIEILRRIKDALDAAAFSISNFIPGLVSAEYKSGDDPVTEADRAANRALRESLVRDGEGWLSEESDDDLRRLDTERVWVVDPLDGTREFVAGIPEWCISVGLVENGRSVAGGVSNPATNEVFLGALGQGITYNGNLVRQRKPMSLFEATVLASRSEVKRGEWVRFAGAPFDVQPIGSVAYKLALVAAGLADATWTLSPKHEWDVAGGVALVESAGGFVQGLDGSALRFNNSSTLLSGLVAGWPRLPNEIASWLAH